MSLETGPALVVVVYALALALVVFLPRRFVEGDETPPPWWRNVRFWAALVAALQMLVYAVFG